MKLVSKFSLAACVAFLAAGAAEVAAATRGVRGLTADVMPVSGNWTCAPVTACTADWYDYDGDGTPSDGDCLAFPPAMAAQVDWAETVTSTGLIPGTSTLASFSINKTCGGYTIVELVAAPDSSEPADPDAEPPADLTCPTNTMPVTKSNVGVDETAMLYGAYTPISTSDDGVMGGMSYVVFGGANGALSISQVFQLTGLVPI
jgi:hypothetical protein